VVDFKDIQSMDLVIEWDNRFLRIIKDTEFSLENEDVDISIDYGDNTVKVSIQNKEEKNITISDSTIIFNLNFSVITQNNEISVLQILEDTELFSLQDGQEVNVGYYPQDGYVAIVPDGFDFFENEGRTIQICEGETYAGKQLSGEYIESYQSFVGGIWKKRVRKYKLESFKFSNLDCANDLIIEMPEAYEYVNIPIESEFSVSPNQCTDLVEIELINSTSEIFHPYNPNNFSSANLLGPGENAYQYTFDNGQQVNTCNTNFNIVKTEEEIDVRGFKISDNQVKVGDMFIVDVTFENLRNLGAFFIEIPFDDEELIFLELVPSLELQRMGYLYGIFEENLFVNSSEFMVLPDFTEETVVFSLIFQAKEAGDIILEFEKGAGGIIYDSNSQNENSTYKRFDDLYIFYKRGKIEVEEISTCFDIVDYKTVQICQNESYEFRKQLYQESGIYRDTAIGENGCDSIFLLNLIVSDEATIAKASIEEDFTTCESKVTVYTTSFSDRVNRYWSTKDDNIVIADAEAFRLEASNLPFGDSKFYLTYATDNCPNFSIDSIVITRTAALTTDINAEICQGENYTLNNQAYNQIGTYQTVFSTTNGCDSIVTLHLDILEAPTAFSDTFNTKENVALNFSVLENDLFQDGEPKIQLVSPPHVGQLELMTDGTFQYEPRFGYSGSTTFSYELCYESCLPNGCTTTSVTINIEAAQMIGIAATPIPSPPIENYETSRLQIPDEGEIFVYNVWGQLVEHRSFRENGLVQLRNLQHRELPSGIYFYVKKSIGPTKIIETGKLVAISH